MNAWDTSKINVKHFEELALKWWYEKSKNKDLLKYHNAFDREWEFFERLIIHEDHIIYKKAENKDIDIQIQSKENPWIMESKAKQLDYCCFSANYVNNDSKSIILSYIF